MRLEDEYIKFLSSDDFLKIKKRIKQERGANCQNCSSYKNVQLHFYKRSLKYKNIKDEDLILICDECWKKYTNFKFKGRHFHRKLRK